VTAEGASGADFGLFEKPLETARLTIRVKSTMAIREKRFLNIFISFDQLNVRINWCAPVV
jgi:hypothetical protein